MDDESEQRIALLHSLGILDTPSHESFDRLTSMVCRVLQVPIAVIAFADKERVWFKSNAGLMRDVVQIDHDSMLCSQVFREGIDVAVVHDTSKDRMLRENILVVESPHVRFFVAAPITLTSNNKVLQ
jgi:diguanylate cyclase